MFSGFRILTGLMPCLPPNQRGYFSHLFIVAVLFPKLCVRLLTCADMCLNYFMTLPPSKPTLNNQFIVKAI